MGAGKDFLRGLGGGLGTGFGEGFNTAIQKKIEERDAEKQRQLALQQLEQQLRLRQQIKAEETLQQKNLEKQQLNDLANLSMEQIQQLSRFASPQSSEAIGTLQRQVKGIRSGMINDFDDLKSFKQLETKKQQIKQENKKFKVSNDIAEFLTLVPPEQHFEVLQSIALQGTSPLIRETAAEQLKLATKPPKQKAPSELTPAQIESAVNTILDNARQLATITKMSGTKVLDKFKFRDYISSLSEGAPPMLKTRLGQIMGEMEKAFTSPDLVDTMEFISRVESSNLSPKEKRKLIRKKMDRFQERNPEFRQFDVPPNIRKYF